jgi:hypothetical protein
MTPGTTADIFVPSITSDQALRIVRQVAMVRSWSGSTNSEGVSQALPAVLKAGASTSRTGGWTPTSSSTPPTCSTARASPTALFTPNREG